MEPCMMFDKEISKNILLKKLEAEREAYRKNERMT